MYVSYPPKRSVSEIVKRLKGRSSRRIQEEFPQLGKIYWDDTFGQSVMLLLAQDK
jgi:putative transposase